MSSNMNKAGPWDDLPFVDSITWCENAKGHNWLFIANEDTQAGYLLKKNNTSTTYRKQTPVPWAARSSIMALLHLGVPLTIGDIIKVIKEFK